MKVLIVCSYNSGKIVPFITDQVESLKNIGVIVDFFTIKGKGLWGYIQNLKYLKNKIKEFQPDIIHAHYGMSGLLANLQRKIPVVTTYHGSDINLSKAFFFSKIAIELSAFNIFVSKKNIQKAKPNRNFELLPCGVDTSIFKPLDKKESREKLGFSMDKKIILFAGAFDNNVKNYSLAQNAIKKMQGIRTIELKGFNREQVSNCLNACDLLIMTSFTEGSPQVIKEAMACNCPIVSTDVGDVKQNIQGIDGCFICTYEPGDVAKKVELALAFNKKTNARQKIIELNLDNSMIAKKILSIYNQILVK